MRAKICVSILGETVEAMRGRAERGLEMGADLVELRVDSLRNPDPNDVESLVSRFAERCILTIRPRWEGGLYAGSEEERLELLSRASRAGPAYIDLEFRTGNLMEVAEALRRCSRLIVSLHDWDGALGVEELRRAALEAMEVGDYAKIVATARTMLDNVKILSLYRHVPRSRLIAFAMGELGVVSRILSPMMGAPIAYACLPGEQAAPGQLSLIEMVEVLRLVESV